LNRDRCSDFKIIFTKKFGGKIGVFTQTAVSFCIKLIITLAFEENANFIAENWQKIAENC
jgi:hypothetical protein